MYKHEVEKHFIEGGKIRRESWPKGHYICQAPEGEISLDEEESKACGLAADAEVTVATGLIVYCEGKQKAIYGHALSSTDLVAQDWAKA